MRFIEIIVPLAVQKTQKYLSTGLILLLFAMQLGTLHQFSHDENSVPCKICLTAHQAQSLDYNPVAGIEAPEVSWVFIKQDIGTEYAFAKAELLSFSYLSRPPPVSY